MSRDKKHLSHFQLALKNFGTNQWAVVALWLLIILYLTVIFADFISPYSYDNEDRNFSYCPPAKIHWMTQEGKLSWPFVYAVYLTFDEYHQRIYLEDKTKRFPLQLLGESDPYKFLGLVPSKVHFFGVTPPGRIYLWGADSRGRDLFSRIFHGGRISLSIGLIGVVISFCIGLLVGGVSGYYAGRIDNFLMRLCEMFMMVPGFYLMLALRSAVPDNFNSLQVYLSVVIILSFIGWAGLARIIRGMAISLREREYVLAAKTMGVSDFKIIISHILPHTMSYSIVAIMLSIPGYILGEAALSLIGLGIQDPVPSWGNLLSEAMGIVYVKFAPWILLPGLFIFLTVICFNVLGDHLRDCLDPLFKEERKV